MLEQLFFLVPVAFVAFFVFIAVRFTISAGKEVNLRRVEPEQTAGELGLVFSQKGIISENDQDLRNSGLFGGLFDNTGATKPRSVPLSGSQSSRLSEMVEKTGMKDEYLEALGSSILVKWGMSGSYRRHRVAVQVRHHQRSTGSHSYRESTYIVALFANPLNCGLHLRTKQKGGVPALFGSRPPEEIDGSQLIELGDTDFDSFLQLYGRDDTMVRSLLADSAFRREIIDLFTKHGSLYINDNGVRLWFTGKVSNRQAIGDYFDLLIGILAKFQR